MCCFRRESHPPFGLAEFGLADLQLALELRGTENLSAQRIANDIDANHINKRDDMRDLQDTGVG